MKKVFIGGWIFISFLWFLYSYTQVDLSLTFSRASFYQTVEKWFQYIGWFNRPLSTELFVALLLISFIFFCFSLIWIQQNKISESLVWKMTIIIGVILFFAYNAFSYDLFNYIFDAKIFTHYSANPYLHKALDYPNDPMLSFMHWTQRTYPYGPTWLVVTVPLSFIGMNIFSFTFFLFKALIAGSYILSGFFIKRIAEKTKIISPVFALALFALNPLIFIESVISAHLDIVMIMIALWSLYLFTQKKYVWSGIIFIFAGAMKYASAFALPGFLYIFFKKKRDVKTYEMGILIMVLFLILAVIASSVRTNFQPWYLLDVLPFAALVSHKKYILIPSIVMSIAAEIQYIPFLFTGNWNPPIPTILNEMLLGGITVSIIAIGIVQLRKNL